MRLDDTQQKDVNTLQQYIDVIRHSIQPFLKARNRNFSSEQLFEFMMALPTAMVIALDGEIDDFEEKVLTNMLAFAHRYYDEQLNEETHLLFENLQEPDERVRAFDFPEILNDEIRYIISNYAQHQSDLISALKEFLKMDDFIQKRNPMLRSLKYTILEVMYIIFKKNHGDDDLEEKGFNVIISEVGIKPDEELLQKIIQSVA